MQFWQIKCLILRARLKKFTKKGLRMLLCLFLQELMVTTYLFSFWLSYVDFSMLLIFSSVDSSIPF